MKIMLFILLSILLCAVVYASVELFCDVINKVQDKWLYNKGICRNCGGVYRFYNSVDNYEFHECTKCGQMILIKKSNTTQ